VAEKIPIPRPSASELPAACPADWPWWWYRFEKLIPPPLASRPGSRSTVQRQKEVVWVFSQTPRGCSDTESCMKDEKELLASNVVDDLGFWLMTAAIISAVFVCGMAVGGWMTWQYLAPGMQPSSPAVLPVPVPVPLPIPVPVQTMIPTPVTIFVTPNGGRFHTKQDCSGLRIAGRTSTKTRCLICA
jgi:hypothetical protein